MCLRSNQNALLNLPSQNAFTQSFLSEVQKDYAVNETLITCPIGVLFLLSTLFGSGAARGRTGLQLAQTLQLRSQLTGSDLIEARNEAKLVYGELHDDLTSQQTFINDRRTNVMTITNGIFTQVDFDLREDFLYSVKNDFQSTAQELNFSNQAESARQINNWVNKATFGLIQRIFNRPEELPTETRVALFNVFTFKDKWQREFTPGSTEDEEFYVSETHTVRVPIMNQNEELMYGNMPNKGISLIKKPLQNHRFSIIIVLPTRKWDVAALTPVLDGSLSIKDLIPNLDIHAVSLKLPKFKMMETKNLIPTLELMGTTDLFSRETSDLTGISESENLYISILKQSVALKVDEAGVEAAAVTGGIAVATSFLHTTVEFHVNHPFLCILYDEHLNMPLVVARIMKPET